MFHCAVVPLFPFITSQPDSYGSCQYWRRNTQPSSPSAARMTATPTTAAPMAVALTTVVPMTSAPTTAAPTTAAPTKTAALATVAPTTAYPCLLGVQSGSIHS